MLLLLHELQPAAHASILVLVVLVVLVVVVVTVTLPFVVARRDAKDHAAPLVLDPLGQVDHLRNLRTILSVNLDHAAKLTVREQVRTDIERVNNLENLADNFDVWVGAVGQGVQPVGEGVATAPIEEVSLNR